MMTELAVDVTMKTKTVVQSEVQLSRIWVKLIR
jgi:hypothetical protein